MTIKVKHKFHSAKADGTDITLVKPTNWNEDHDLQTDATGPFVIGRDNTGPGPLQELPLAYYASSNSWGVPTNGSFQVPQGTTAQRPAGMPNGAMRWNTDTNTLEISTPTGWQTIFVGQSLVPPGTILGYGGTGVPTGFLLCNGGRYNRTSFPALWSAIALNWGGGDDGATFLVPNLTGRALVGADYSGSVLGFGMGVGGYYGNPTLGFYISEAQLPAHRHWHARDTDGNPQGIEYSNNGGAGVTGSGNAMQDAGYSTTWSGNTGSGQVISMTNIQPSGFGYYIIKT